MKKIASLLLITLLCNAVMANPGDSKKKRYVPKATKIINPKLGMVISNITEAPSQYQTKAKVGLLAGADLRFGKRLYFQPGGFYKQEGTLLIYNDGNVEQENDIKKNSVCVKAQAGYYLVNKEGFRIRFNAGPSLDIALKQKIMTTVGVPSNQDWLSGSGLNLEAGVGLDIWFLSIDAGYTYGLGDAFRKTFTASNTAFANSKLTGAYLNAGVVIPIQRK
ncbi:MAG: PorT family protein [Chitinophagaceae bacterium]|nr:PorT family protein [Chitinophagaceae bacterium]